MIKKCDKKNKQFNQLKIKTQKTIEILKGDIYPN